MARADQRPARRRLTIEPIHSRAALHASRLAAAAFDWTTALTVTALPEAQPYPRVYAHWRRCSDAIEAAPAARGWATALVRYELLLLAELGFGLDLDRCVVTGATNDLGFVSPKSGAAVSRAAAAGREPRLLRLPAFLREGGEADWADILAGLALTGHFLARDILIDRRTDPLGARERLIDRLKRAVCVSAQRPARAAA